MRGDTENHALGLSRDQWYVAQYRQFYFKQENFGKELPHYSYMFLKKRTMIKSILPDVFRVRVGAPLLRLVAPLLRVVAPLLKAEVPLVMTVVRV
jgi:hypothetical protein